MIILTDVATKLSEILNSADCPVRFKFVVKSQGYHLDSIADHKTGENLIPVFLTMVGGEYNPVPNLHEANFTYGVTIWFPIRFKEDFYALNEYLEETFVGKKIEIGNKVALCNISVAEYGEITGLHLDQFEEWLEDTYEGNVHIFKKEHDISEEYMSMEFRLFATTLGDGFLFGNDVKYELTAWFPQYYLDTIRIYYKNSHAWFVYNRNQSGDDLENKKYCFQVNSRIVYIDVDPSNFDLVLKGQFSVYIFEDNKYQKIDNDIEIQNKTYSTLPYPFSYSTDLVFSQGGTGLNVSPVSQQLIKVDRFAKNIPNIINFNKSAVVYAQDDLFWTNFLYAYNTQNMQSVTNMKLVKKYANGMQFEYSQIVLTANENIQLGEPLSFTLTFGDKK